jgi:TPR repeat protein
MFLTDPINQSIAQGDALAQYNVAVAYEDGRGVTQDFDLAAKYYQMASEQDVVDAKHNLACLYLLGKVCPLL